MSRSSYGARVVRAFRGIRPVRLLLLVAVAVAAGLTSDWLRDERVLFPAPLPPFKTIPARR